MNPLWAEAAYKQVMIGGGCLVVAPEGEWHAVVKTVSNALMVPTVRPAEGQLHPAQTFVISFSSLIGHESDKAARELISGIEDSKIPIILLDSSIADGPQLIFFKMLADLSIGYLVLPNGSHVELARYPQSVLVVTSDQIIKGLPHIVWSELFTGRYAIIGPVEISHGPKKIPHHRDWELLFRIADLLWARLGDHPEVYRRRQDYLVHIRTVPLPCSTFEADRFQGDINSLREWVAHQWCRLFDDWRERQSTFVFEDGFGALFLTRLLFANTAVLLRGHYNSAWRLSSSLQRSIEQCPNDRQHIEDRARRFLETLSRQDFIRNVYPNGIPRNHQEAILQHYGFPTELIDCTYSYDVALFFAEGASDSFPLSSNLTACGAIYVFPTNVLFPRGVITTLPPSIMRPSLQRGVFIRGLKVKDLHHLEQHKYTFLHKAMPVWNGIGDIPFGSPIGLSKYLFPISDPIEAIAQSCR